jgi:RNA polymerase sigma-70 factor (ECF subfamily)
MRDLAVIRMSRKVLPFRKDIGPEPSDEALISSCAAGERNALAELFHRHATRVYRILGRQPGVDGRDLEDLVQTTFIEVYRAAAGYSGTSSVGTWILGIALNVMRHHVRGEFRRRTLYATAAAEAPFTAKERPDEDAARRQLIARLETGLAALPDDLRLAFTLCELEGVKGADVARMLGLREGTLWRKLYEARLRLRAALDPGGTK